MIPVRFHSLLLDLCWFFLLYLTPVQVSFKVSALEAKQRPSEDGRLSNGYHAVLVKQECPLKPEATTTGSRKLRGWRMVEKAADQVMGSMKAEEGNLEAASKISGATLIAKCENEKEGEHKLSVIDPRSILPMSINVGGFLSFSADYYVPKPHPPKNIEKKITTN